MDRVLIVLYIYARFHENILNSFQLTERPASVAQLDARPTGHQKVAGSTPAEVGNILRGD